MTNRRLLVLLVLAAACSNDDGAGGGGAWPGDDGVETVTVDLGAGFEADVPAEWEIRQTFAAPGAPGDECGSLPAAIDAGTVFLALGLPAAICAGTQQPEPLNGAHGDYVTVDDVAQPREVVTDDVPLGALTTFLQTYTECTNECVESDDRVALVALAAPPDADHPTLMIRAPGDDVSEAQLIALVAAIRRA